MNWKLLGKVGAIPSQGIQISFIINLEIEEEEKKGI